jgi:Ice-binding-like
MSTVSKTTKSRTRVQLLVALSAFSLSALLPFHMAIAQIAPSLGMAESFAVLGASTVTNTGPTVITGDLGVSPGTAITGFPPGVDIGATHAADAVALQAQSDTTTAYTILAGEACDTTFAVPTDIGGLTLVPGVYCFTSSAQITGALTLDAGGDPNAVWVFKVGSTLVTASSASVVLINGAQACNVFWQVGSSATIGTDTTFVGNILALTSITITTDATLSGRALAQNGAVTMDSNVITVSSCIAPVTPIPPTVGKAFSPATITAGGSSTLTITLSNANVSAASITSAFTDTLPGGVTVNGAPSTTCGGTVTSGASSVTLTGGAIPANGSCTVTVPVTAPNGGTYINSVPVGALVTSNGNNTVPAVATLTVNTTVVAPTVGKAFSPAIISTGGASTLTITLSNANASAASISSPFTDTLPSGVTITSMPSNTCGGTVTYGVSFVTLTGGSIPANASCTITAPVTAPSGGNFINSIAAGALVTSNGTNAAPAVATLTVNAPSVTPTLAKAFSPAVIAAGGASTLTITLINNNASAASITSPLTDTLPAGVTISSTPTNSCGGVISSSTSSVTLTGGSIPANGSCIITVPVTATTGGNFINSLAVGALVTSNGNNTAPAIATLTVNSAVVLPTLSKAFNPATIAAGDASTLTLTLSNSDASVASITSPLTDTLPAGVTIASAPSNTCGGSITFTSSSVTLTGGSIPARGSCTITVPVTAPNGGNFINSLPAGALQTNNGNSASPVVATLTVTPAVPKQFSYQCEFAADVKNAEISCEAKGSVCIEPVPSNGSCTKHNSLEITCDNGFKFSDHAAIESFANQTLQISGVSGSAQAELAIFNFENVSDTLEASLQVKSDDLFLKVFGSCELTQLPLRRN